MRRKTVGIIAAGVLAAGGLAAGAAVAAGASTGDGDTPISGADLDRATEAALAHTGGGRVTETEAGDDESFYEVEVTLDDGSEVDVQLDRNFAVVSSTADREDGDGDDADDSDRPITGADFDRASEAALAHTGGGRVTDTEAGDDESFYEVEVTLDDGSEVDVQLDESFNVVGSTPDNDDDGPDDDGADD
ncbi:MAG TPA: PepSY domain-containing protein [Ilumatobacteraceae bacterium]